MKIRIHNHQNKALGLARALFSLGHTLTADNVYDLLLIDFDASDYYRPQIDAAVEIGATVALYSHGGLSCTAWDGVWEPHPGIDVYLAYSSAEAALLNSYGYPHPVEVVGWHWCEQSPFRARHYLNRTLFAPLHPLGNGYMRPEVSELNRATFERLLDVPGELTVRYLGDLEANGIPVVPGVQYVPGAADNSYADIDRADLVVAGQTYGMLAYARGVPTLLYGQDLRPWDGHTPETLRFVRSWEQYPPGLRAPDVNDGPIEEMARQVMRARDETWVRWRIGAPLDPQRLERVLLEAHATTQKKELYHA